MLLYGGVAKDVSVVYLLLKFSINILVPQIPDKRLALLGAALTVLQVGVKGA